MCVWLLSCDWMVLPCASHCCCVIGWFYCKVSLLSCDWMVLPCASGCCRVIGWFYHVRLTAAVWLDGFTVRYRCCLVIGQFYHVRLAAVVWLDGFTMCVSLLLCDWTVLQRLAAACRNPRRSWWQPSSSGSASVSAVSAPKCSATSYSRISPSSRACFSQGTCPWPTNPSSKNVLPFCVVDQKPTSELMAAMQLGIGQSITSLSTKPKRDLLLQDFSIVETVYFSR